MSNPMASEGRLSARQITAGTQWVTVLRWLVSKCPREQFMPFSPIIEGTGLTRTQVRRACRSLRRMGLAEYERGLWSEDGEPRGAGYAPTDKARALALGTAP